MRQLVGEILEVSTAKTSRIRHHQIQSALMTYICISNKNIFHYINHYIYLF